MIKTITEGKSTFCMVSVPVNYKYGFISKSGKSFVYRVEGTYLDSKGVTRGSEGTLSTYLSRKLPFEAWNGGKSLSIRDAVMFDFDGIEMLAFEIYK